jgi:hypothetical protein
LDLVGFGRSSRMAGDGAPALPGVAHAADDLDFLFFYRCLSVFIVPISGPAGPRRPVKTARKRVFGSVFQLLLLVASCAADPYRFRLLSEASAFAGKLRRDESARQDGAPRRRGASARGIGLGDRSTDGNRGRDATRTRSRDGYATIMDRGPSGHRRSAERRYGHGSHKLIKMSKTSHETAALTAAPGTHGGDCRIREDADQDILARCMVVFGIYFLSIFYSKQFLTLIADNCR